MTSPLQAPGPGEGVAWQTKGHGGKVHTSLAGSGAVPTRTPLADATGNRQTPGGRRVGRGWYIPWWRRKQSIIHKACGSRPGMVHPMHRAGPRARTPRTLQASGSTNHLPAESRRKPDRSTASNMRDTRLPPGARRGKAPPWVGDGRRRLGEGEGRSWQPPFGHGPGRDAQVLLLADAARECTYLADAAGTRGLRKTHTRHPGAGGTLGSARWIVEDSHNPQRCTQTLDNAQSAPHTVA